MTARLETFTDGVFAIAITLLILEIKVPPADQDLWLALAAHWGSFAAFFISFIVIGTYWIQHHRMFRVISHVNGWLLLINLAFLLTIAFIPFPTAVLADRLVAGREIERAVAFYGLAMFLLALTFTILLNYLWWGRLLKPEADTPELRQIKKMGWISVVSWGIASGLAFLAPFPVLAYDLVMPLAWSLNGARAEHEELAQ